MHLPVSGRLTARVRHQAGQHVGQEVAGIAQAVQQRHVAHISDAGFGGKAGRRAQRQAARTIQQRQMQKVARTANPAPAQQSTMRAGAGVQINNRRNVADHVRPTLKAGR